MKKWIVTVTLEWDMPVVAETSAEAERVATANARHDLDHIGIDPTVNAREVTTREELPPDWTGCAAYVPRAVPVSDDDRNVDRWLK